MSAPLYNWSEWFAKKMFSVRKGVDYHVGSGTMCQTIRNEASKRGVGVRLVEIGGEEQKIVVLVTEKRKTKVTRGNSGSPNKILK